jgi:hypothetical protein
MKLNISCHALDRWRERFGQPNDKVDEPLKFLQAAIQEQGKPRKGYQCFKYQSIIFLVNTDAYRSNVVTIVPDEETFFKHAPSQKIDFLEEEAIFKMITGIKEKRDWLHQTLKEVEKELKFKDNTARLYLKRKKIWIENKFRETKDEWCEYCLRKDSEKISKQREAQELKELQERYSDWYPELKCVGNQLDS